MFDPQRCIRGQHQSGALAQPRQSVNRLAQNMLIARLAVQLRRNGLALFVAQLTDLQQPIDKNPQPGLGRQATGGNMGRIKQPMGL